MTKRATVFYRKSSIKVRDYKGYFNVYVEGGKCKNGVYTQGLILEKCNGPTIQAGIDLPKEEKEKRGLLKIHHAKHSSSRRLNNVFKQGIRASGLGIVLGVAGIAFGGALGIPALMTAGFVTGIAMPLVRTVYAGFEHPKKTDWVRIGPSSVMEFASSEENKQILIHRNPDNLKQWLIDYWADGERVGREQWPLKSLNGDKIDQLAYIIEHPEWWDIQEHAGGYKQLVLPNMCRVKEVDERSDEQKIQEAYLRMKASKSRSNGQGDGKDNRSPTPKQNVSKEPGNAEAKTQSTAQNAPVSESQVKRFLRFGGKKYKSGSERQKKENAQEKKPVAAKQGRPSSSNTR